MEIFSRRSRSKRGQGLVEYALIIGLVSIVIIATLTAMGGSISGMFSNNQTTLSNAFAAPS